jgi:hypothetical protein
MSTTAAVQQFNSAEPIPGYRIQQRIGAGGYGEVWRAEAPGGIAKAIKVVYGYHDSDRATQELNALNRIKEVRHPFVLSLERIELIDGHLVIVTELATSSLKNLFEEYRRSGLLGIPRGELLTHLYDAADALDYICREHSLQHLDVKPENLLLVGGRIKVADFGLVKDLQDVNCSIITGLTPVYAAPELFDGRPNNHSDQYSLAIVYQEMLTGEPPFQGRTTAQLAAQHLHGRPQLDRLPASDQATIARALSKNPEQRFPSCREMIESLREVTPNQRGNPSRSAAGSGGYGPPPSAPVKTEILARDSLRGGMAAATLHTTSRPTQPAPAMRDLPPLVLCPEDLEYRPTIFVGIGGLAAKTLQSLERRLADRFGDVRAVPALQLLLLETDAETLKAVTEGDEQASLSNDETLLLPLRQAADYRRESSNHLQWLSRRWIYNIPRSLQTQGLRPLGRLALVDHCQRVKERLARAIQSAMEPQGLAASAEKTGLPFRTAPPRIFIVSSISGGTGSGMALDLAYMVRKLLRDLGLAEEGICGLLAHCTSRDLHGRDLAVANAYSFLTELHHYSDCHQAYPGAATCDLPAFGPQDPPFTHTYVVHLGEDLEQKDFQAAADKLAKYLYSNTVTRAAAFFDKCRAAPVDGLPLGGGGPTVRTFGLCQLGFAYDDVPAAVADDLCKTLVTRWRGTARDEPEDHPASLADPTSLLATHLSQGLVEEKLRAEVVSHSAEVGLSVEQIVAELQAAIAREMNDDPQTYLLSVLGQLMIDHQSGRLFSRRSPPAELILDTLDGLVRPQHADDAHRVCLESALEKHLQESAAGRAAALGEWILGLIASPRHRVEKAQRAVDYLVERLRELTREVGEIVQSRQRELGPLKLALRSEDNGGRDWLRFRGFASRRRLVADRRLSLYFCLSIEELTYNGVRRVMTLILAQMTALGDTLRNLAADLNRLADEFSSLPAQAGGGQGSVAEMLAGHKAELVAEMERDLEDALRRAVINDANDVRRVLPQALRLAARAAILRALHKNILQEIHASGAGDSQESLFSPGVGLLAATPRLSACGGGRRLLLATAENLSPAQLLPQLGAEAGQASTVLDDAENGALLCYEAEQLSLRHVTAAVLDQRSQYAELASRLHTRVDVTWLPL